MAHINKRTTAAGKARWDVRWKALGRWQTKTFQRRQDADAFRRTVEADELRGVVVDVRRSSEQFEEYATDWLATRRRPDGRPLTSERLFARANAALNEIGYTTAEMIIAGSPGCAVPHYRGEGQLRANAPIIIDIFPRGMTSRYHGDLTRTVVVGEVSEQVRRMHEACLAALDWAAGQIKAGADGRAVHRGACQVLVDHGFGTYTKGLEGNLDGPRMNHSLGHGVGLGVHEPPSLRDLDYPLQAGDVVTVEPGLYLQGLGGVRVEDTGLVTAEGFRNFTTLPRSLDPRAYL